MIEHKNLEAKNPSRVVILGAGGFVGSILKQTLQSDGIPVLAVTSKDVDLTQEGSADKLASMLKSDDSVIMLSAITPDKGRDIDTFMRNMKMASNVCGALQKCPVAHTVYLSSDAVYPAELSQVSEETSAAPADLYGTMHKAREVMFQSTVTADSLAVLRLTITYGITDTHNSYGPNRFRRSSQQEKKITLFGDGEETRDHIFVEDTVALIMNVLRHRSHGLLNLATGKSYSFMDVAQKVVALFDTPVEIICTPRKSSITHRHYDVTNIYKAFPHMQWTSLEEGLKKVHHQMLQLALEPA